jgi:hypothetical protein
MADRQTDIDIEIESMRAIVGALMPLDRYQRTRVLNWVHAALNDGAIPVTRRAGDEATEPRSPEGEEARR